MLPSDPRWQQCKLLNNQITPKQNPLCWRDDDDDDDDDDDLLVSCYIGSSNLLIKSLYHYQDSRFLLECLRLMYGKRV
jgi:hypothetical protein